MLHSPIVSNSKNKFSVLDNSAATFNELKDHFKNDILEKVKRITSASKRRRINLRGGNRGNDSNSNLLLPLSSVNDTQYKASNAADHTTTNKKLMN